MHLFPFVLLIMLFDWKNTGLSLSPSFQYEKQFLLYILLYGAFLILLCILFQIIYYIKRERQEKVSPLSMSLFPLVIHLLFIFTSKQYTLSITRDMGFGHTLQSAIIHLHSTLQSTSPLLTTTIHCISLCYILILNLFLGIAEIAKNNYSTLKNPRNPLTHTEKISNKIIWISLNT